MKKLIGIFVFLFAGILFANDSLSNGENLVEYFNGMKGWLVEAPHGKEFVSQEELLRYPIPHLINDGAKAYHEALIKSWGWENVKIKKVSSAYLENFALKTNIVMSPSTFILGLTGNNFNKLYDVVDSSSVNIVTGITATEKYGKNWRDRLIEIPAVFFTNYRVDGSWIGYIMSPKEVIRFYLLPGERFDHTFVLSNDPNSPYGSEGEKKIISYQANYYKQDWKAFLTAETFFEHNPVSMDTGISFHRKEDNSGYTMISVLPNSSNTYYYRSHFLCLSGVRAREGVMKNVFLKANFVDESLQEKETILPLTFAPVNRIRGDVNGDGKADAADRDLYLEIYDSREVSLTNAETYLGRYTGPGLINLGTMSLPGHSNPSFTALTMFNIWINNPNDPKVQGLGFGRLMSETAYQKSSRSSSANYQIINGKLVVKTDPAAAVNVFAITKENKIFQKDSFAGSNGEAIFDIPDTSLAYRVEVCPINQATIIASTVGSYKNVFSFSSGAVHFNLTEAGVISLKVFDLRGRAVATLADKRESGKHSVSLKGLNVSRGNYLCVLEATGKKSVMKVNIL